MKQKMFALFVLCFVFFILFASVVAAQDDEDVEKIPNFFDNWLPTIVLAGFVVIIFHGLLYGIGHSFSQRELEQYAKSEILQGWSTIFIAVFTVLIFEAITDPVFMGDIIGGTIPCGNEQLNVEKIHDAIGVIKCRLSDKAYVLSDIQQKSLEGSEGVFRFLTWYNSIYGIPVFQGSWLTSKYRESENYRIIHTISTTLLISLNSQINFIDYVEKNALLTFLPVGIILRSFFFTRGIGAFFIAIAIGLYFIFPILYIITDPGFVKALPLPPVTNTGENFCYPVFAGSAVLLGGPTGGGAEVGFGLSIENAAKEISKIYFGILLQPFVILSITLIFVRYMMYLLGGEPYEVMRYVARVV